MKTIGIFNVDPWTLLDKSSMKKELLYFDHLKYSFPGKDILKKFCASLPNGMNSYDARMREIEELEKFGLLSEYSSQQFENDFNRYKEDKLIELARKRYNLSIDFLASEGSFETVFIDFLERFREVGQLEARRNAILLNKFSDNEFVPIIRGNYYNNKIDEFFKKSIVLSVVVKKFPEIDDVISPEKLVELKNDDGAILKLNRLKNWTSDLKNEKLTEKEINQKIEYLLMEYKNQLDLHKIKYEMGIVETYITIGLEVLENIVKLNLSKAAKVFFDIQKKELKLLEAEAKISGKEVAYIHHLNENRL